MPSPDTLVDEKQKQLSLGWQKHSELQLFLPEQHQKLCAIPNPKWYILAPLWKKLKDFTV